MKINKKLHKTLTATFIALTAAFASSCSDSDDHDGYFPGETDDGKETVDKVNPSNVFTGLAPLQAGNYIISYDEDNGLVKQISTRGTGFTRIASFSYPALSRTVSLAKQVRMEVISGDDRHVFALRINDHGFADYAEETEYDGNSADRTEYWWFTYDRDNHLTKIERTDDDHEIIHFDYKDGNMTMMTKDDRDGDRTVTYVTYDSTPNKGAVMMFDGIFNTDIDEMEFAYYAGLLGTATADLPVSVRIEEDRKTYNASFAWTLNADGYPTSMTPSNEPRTYNFAWK